MRVYLLSPPAMPDWSPVRSYGGYAAWAASESAGKADARSRLAMSCSCDNTCNIHGHRHAVPWSSKLPISDLRTFWGTLGCSCWAV